MIELAFLKNLDLFSVGAVVAAIIILGFIVYFNNRQSATNRIFLFFCIITATWGTVNYLNYQVSFAEFALILLRLVLFFAVFQAFLIYALFDVFPDKDVSWSKIDKFVVLPAVLIVAFLTLSEFVIPEQSVVFYTSGQGGSVEVEKGIILFGLVSVSLVIAGLSKFIRKTLKATREGRTPYAYILLGAGLTFLFIILGNFILPAFFGVYKFIPFGGVFTIPFIVLTSYAIFRHGLLNVKIVSTEILIFVLALATFIEVIVSDNIGVLFFRVSIFSLVVGLGILLVRSVIREVKQREELEVLSKELASANEQLKALDKARAEFISIASHQLRTPPATIKWYLGAVLNGDFGSLNDELKAALARTNVTNEAQISTIDDLLNASRIERGKLEFFFESFNLEPMVKTLVEQLEPLAQMKKQHLVYNAPTMPIPDIIVDHEKVRQVVNNMIDNAIKYSKVGDIQIQIMADDKNITVKVKDTGKGIEKSELENVFNKYARGKDSATHATGLGLGMYVAKVIIEQHNGKIWAESDGPGKGSTFAFSLPIKSELKASTLDLAQEMAPEPAPTTEPEQKAV